MASDGTNTTSTSTAVIAGVVVAITVFALAIGCLYYYVLHSYYTSATTSTTKRGSHLQRPRRHVRKHQNQQQQDADVELGHRSPQHPPAAQKPQQDTVQHPKGPPSLVDTSSWIAATRPPQRRTTYADSGSHQRGKCFSHVVVDESDGRRGGSGELGLLHPIGHVQLSKEGYLARYDSALDLQLPINTYQPSPHKSSVQTPYGRPISHHSPLSSHPPDLPAAIFSPTMNPTLQPVVAVATRCCLPRGHRRSVCQRSPHLKDFIKEAWDPEYFVRFPRPEAEPSLRTTRSRKGRGDRVVKTQMEKTEELEKQQEDQTDQKMEMETEMLTEVLTEMLTEKQMDLQAGSQAEGRACQAEMTAVDEDEDEDSTDFSSSNKTETQTSASTPPAPELASKDEIVGRADSMGKNQKMVDRSDSIGKRRVNEREQWKRNGMAADGRCSWRVVEAYALKNGWVEKGPGEEVIVG